MKRHPLLLFGLCALLFVLAFSLAWFSRVPPDRGQKTGDGGQPAQAAAPRDAPPPAYREITWDDLIPQDWDPAQGLGIQDFSTLRDNDPRAVAALQALRAAWDRAPIVPELDGQRVRLAGYVIPLEKQGESVTEALFVPYFGACIHTPPPPANQTIHIVFQISTPAMNMMDAFWIGGTLKTERGGSEGLGIYGYRLLAEHLEPYLLPPESGASFRAPGLSPVQVCGQNGNKARGAPGQHRQHDKAGQRADRPVARMHEQGMS
ncbi:MAG: DUF3299 domain-containing protein [Azoarcus sp.]|jgi:hypothetical protein|nr:DUF3299 domain-containing protein [Azoarcus sp.]